MYEQNKLLKNIIKKTCTIQNIKIIVIINIQNKAEEINGKIIQPSCPVLFCKTAINDDHFFKCGDEFHMLKAPNEAPVLMLSVVIFRTIM